MALYLGCPVWGDKRWVGNFFPAGTKPNEFLEVYSRRLNTVEGNTTFYAMPKPETMERWREETPPGFQFCFKFPQTISHRKRLQDAAVETTEWIDLLRLVGDRNGPSFLQLPPSFGPDLLAILRNYLASLPDNMRFAVEVRNPGWFMEPSEGHLDAALAEYGMARVLFDVRGLREAEPEDAVTAEAQERKPDVPVRHMLTAPFTMVRYIANPDIPANAGFLDEWADTVAGWLETDIDVYFFLHHPDNFWSPALCRDFYARLSRRIPLPPLPYWPDPEPPTIQTSMF